MKHNSIFILILVVLIIRACATQSLPTAAPEAPIDKPNSASQHCADQGGELEIRDEVGGQVG